MAKKVKVSVRMPKQISDDGFSLEEAKSRINSFALLSLRIALQAYFSTYKSMWYCLHGVIDPMARTTKQDTDYLHSAEYCSLYGQAIVHFQHFAELVCKDFLRELNQLLPIVIEDDPLILLKLARGEEVRPEEYDKINTVEFRVALERVLGLLKAERLDPSARIIADAEKFLRSLNVLRNRLLHRGTWVLRYEALDELVGAHLLPFVKKVTVLPKYAGHEPFWKYHDLKCGVDPMDAIADDWARGEYDVMKVAMLKELGRAAYEQPAWGDEFNALLETGERRRGERLAAAELKARVGSEVRECPVCGVNALVQYEDYEVVTNAEGWPMPGPRFPYRYQCASCSLEISYDLNNPSNYGLPIPDLWPAPP